MTLKPPNMKIGLLAFLLLLLPVSHKNSVYEYTLKNIDGEDVSLRSYEGKVLLLVNTASECGLTPQYAEIESFYQEFKDRGVTVLGFPSNDFGEQEPGTDEEIKAFCSAEFSVTFPMFSKISVKGENKHPLYASLMANTFGNEMDGEVKWNFQKYLVDKQGHVAGVFHPRTSVKDKEFIEAVEKLLSE